MTARQDPFMRQALSALIWSRASIPSWLKLLDPITAPCCRQKTRQLRLSNRSEPAAVWLKRNGLLTRWLHGTNALTVLILLFTGLALGDRFGDGLVELSGGHELINDVHQWLGTGYTVAAAVLALVFARKTAGLLRDMAVFRRTDWAWMPAFARHYFRPGHHAPPFHEGRFDPAQRLAFIGLTVSLVLVAASGIVLVAFVDMSRAVLM